MKQKLTIVIPCYNEERYVDKVLTRIMEVNLDYGLEKEVIIVNDGSTDSTQQKIEFFAVNHPQFPLKLIQHSQNEGKGSCIKTALTETSGDIIAIQDADMEYDPIDFNRMLQPIMSGHADVVYGSRLTGSYPHRTIYYWHFIGNKFLTAFSNLFTGLNLSDMETGYKIFKTEALSKITLKEKKFGFEPEVTAKISKLKNIRIYETGISYYGRTYEEGKKINWSDGFRAIYCIIKYNLFSRK